MKELLEKKIRIEKAKKQRRVQFFLRGTLPRVQTWDKKYFHDGKKAFKYLRGLEAEETERGIGWNLLLVPDGKTKGFGRREIGLPLELIFEDPLSLVSDIKAGLVRTRIDSKGVFHEPEELASNPGKGYRRVAELKKKYEQEIAELRQELNKAYSELENAKKREAKIQLRLMDTQMSSNINDFRADMSQGMLVASLEKIKGMMQDYKSVLISAQESEVNRVLTERLNETLIEAFHSVREKLGKELPKDVEELIKEKVTADFYDKLDILHELSPRKVEIEKRTIPKEKKKGEE